MIERKEGGGDEPFVLGLGSGCARAAGVPSVEDMARELFSNLKTANPDLASTYLPGSGRKPEALKKAFYSLLAQLAPAQRSALLLQFIASVPVPLFYQELAGLVQAGYFTRILTTNADTLLEQALEAAGLRYERDYAVLVFGVSEADQAAISDASDARITIVKLHGDVSRDTVALTPEEIVEALDPQRTLVRRELRHDLVLVGFEPTESAPLTKQLADAPGDLWWVAPEPPEPGALADIESVREVRYVHGASGSPDMFFGELSLLLVQMPALNALKKPLDEMETLSTASDTEVLADTSPPDDLETFEREYLIGQLRRCEGVLRQLESQAAPTDTSDRVARQIEYQKREIASLEGRLRALNGVRKHILKILQEIDRDAAKTARSNDATVTTAKYLHDQIAEVRKQYRGRNPSPNEDVVSATLGATMILADRLDVRPDLLRELGHFAARSMVRGVW
jgi:SIR2-like protein